MENFVVSARKYRPDTFQTVVAQASITNTLKNAIKGNQLAHAYLFCGPRGVGKTTCARIFAKTINCTNLSPDVEACNECDSCKAFNTSRSFNIHELDAASNNSVDDIRSLTDKVRVPPQMGKYSVYIIDEVHMLSAQAFNAFLKTLEEPPKHALFILATTEKHKIIPTILSRCQIFDFNRISVEDISKHLEFVAASEAVEADAAGLNIIAQKADGAMRDALSIFDQIVSFSGKKISYHDVIENLNVLDYDYYFRLVDQFLRNDVSGVMLTFNEILSNGFDGHHFITGLSSHLRDLLVSRNAETVQLLEVGGEIKQKYRDQARVTEEAFLLDALQISNECDYQYKQTMNKRLLVELALVRIAQLTLKKKIVDAAQATTILEPIFNQLIKAPGEAAITVDKAVNVAKTPIKSEEPTETPEVRRISRENLKVFSTTSIKDALQGKFQEEKLTSKQLHEIFSKEEEKENFSEEQLKLIWETFVAKLGDRPNLQSTLSNLPQIKENFQLELEIENSLQEDLISNIKPELLTWLRIELKNSLIQLNTVYAENSKGRVIYSDAEKFDELLKKNKTLGLLRQKFNLDFGN